MLAIGVLETVRGPLPSGWIVASSDGLRITIGQDSEAPWLARFAVMLRHVPGAGAFLVRPDQPFAAGMTLAQYDALLASAGSRQTPRASLRQGMTGS